MQILQLAHGQRLSAVDPVLARPVLQSLFLDPSSSADVVAVAAELLVRADAAGLPSGYRGRFLKGIAPSALISAREHNIPPSITLAQAILESGWGRSSLAQEGHNLFGVKGPASEPGIQTRSRERGRMVNARYRAYDTWLDSLAHHDALLSQSSRYVAAQAHRDDWRAFLAKMAPVYATSRRYNKLVSGVIQSYRLDRWDALVSRAAVALAAAQEPAPLLGDGDGLADADTGGGEGRDSD